MTPGFSRLAMRRPAVILTTAWGRDQHGSSPPAGCPHGPATAWRGKGDQMADPIKVCVDRFMPAERHVEAAARSIAANPSNTPIPPHHAAPGAPFDHPLSLALLTGYMWFKTGQTLRVRFLDGDPAVQA